MNISLVSNHAFVVFVSSSALALSISTNVMMSQKANNLIAKTTQNTVSVVSMLGYPAIPPAGLYMFQVPVKSLSPPMSLLTKIFYQQCLIPCDASLAASNNNHLLIPRTILTAKSTQLKIPNDSPMTSVPPTLMMHPSSTHLEKV